MIQNIDHIKNNRFYLKKLVFGEYLTNSMEQSHCWEANSHSARQEIPHLLWNPNVNNNNNNNNNNNVCKVESLCLTKHHGVKTYWELEL
jgi:hypothetical protein